MNLTIGFSLKTELEIDNRFAVLYLNDFTLVGLWFHLMPPFLAHIYLSELIGGTLGVNCIT